MQFRHRNLPMLLAQARERVFAQFRPILNAHGVTEQQWRIVRALLETGPLEPRQIGVLCGLSSPSLAGILARMEELALVSRMPVEGDRRRRLISLTDRSRALAARMAPGIEAVYERLGERLDEAKLRGLYRSLDELIALLGPDESRR